MNILLSINDLEDQIYTNKYNITVEKIRNALLGLTLSPTVGNFPHVNGDNEDISVTYVISTRRLDNTGIDISEILNNVGQTMCHLDSNELDVLNSL